MHGEVQDVQLVLVQLVDHEADHLFAVLGHHADAVALPQAAEEVLLGPGEFEAELLGLQDLGHVPANHPADVDAGLFSLIFPFHGTRAHNNSSPGRGADSPPGRPVPPLFCSVHANMRSLRS